MTWGAVLRQIGKSVARSGVLDRPSPVLERMRQEAAALCEQYPDPRTFRFIAADEMCWFVADENEPPMHEHPVDIASALDGQYLQLVASIGLLSGVVDRRCYRGTKDGQSSWFAVAPRAYVQKVGGRG